MRIALVCISLRGGGTERIVCRIANHSADQHDVSIITLVPEESFYRLDERVELVHPVATIQRRAKPLRTVLQLRHLFSACRRSRPDICLVFGEDIAGMACLIARFAGVSRVWTFCRGMPERSLKGANGTLNPLFCRLASRIMVQTQAAKQRLKGTYPAEKIAVWPNPIEVPETVTPAPEREPFIINVGSIGRLKNQEALLRIFSRLDRSGDWRLVFIGDGPERAALEEQASRLDLGESVIFTGQRQDVARHLDQAAIFAFTSLSEGFPNALAEALAAGCACISYDCPTGPSELIEHDVNGLLVPMGDEEGYRHELARLLDDTDLRTRLSEAARRDIRRFSADTVIAEFERLILDENRAV